MSRIGKQPILVPAGVTAELNGAELSMKGPKGLLSMQMLKEVIVDIHESEIVVRPVELGKITRSIWGMQRTLVQNLVDGVTIGFSRKLEINGVGYRAALKGNILNLQLGFSHDVNFPIPEGMDYFMAAAFPVAYGTSHIALTDRAEIKSGQTLLVLGAAGGVGLTAVECGKALGAKVIAAASTKEKLEIAKKHGAHHLINYVDEDLRSSVRKITEGRGVDIVYDPVGGDLSKSAMRSMNQLGRMLIIGFAAGDIPSFPANYLLVKNISVVGVYWGWYRLNRPEIFKKSFENLATWYAEGHLKPHISRVFPLEQVPKALGLLESRQATGRIVIDIDG